MQLPFRRKAAEISPENHEMYPDMAQPVVGTGSGRKKKRLIALVVLLMLVVLAAAWFFFVRSASDEAPKAGGTNQQAAHEVPAFIPRFDNIYSVASFADAKWYAVNSGVIRVQNKKAAYFGNAQGVPTGTAQSLVAYHGRLWLATQHGIAHLNKQGTAFVAEKIPGAAADFANGALFLDDKADTLYLSTFEKFYMYDADAASWTEIMEVANVLSAAANETHLALYASRPGWPIWVHDKAAHTWQKNSPPIEEQSGTVLRVGKEIFLLGRSAGYTSCASAGSVTATSAFRLDSKGAWQPVTEFNADTNRPELHVLKSPTGSMRIKTAPCDQSDTKTYSLAYEGGKLTLSDEKRVSGVQAGALDNYAEQAALISDLKKVTGLQPSMHIWDVDGQGNALFSYSAGVSTTTAGDEPYFGIAAGNDFTKAKLLDMSILEGRENIPILCGTGKERAITYMFSGVAHIAKSAGEGFPDGTWESARLYIVDGTKLKQAVDLGEDLAAPVFACNDEQMAWLGKTHIKLMNRTTNAVSQFGQAVGTDMRYNNSAGAATPSGGLWFAIKTSQADAGSLFYYDAAQGNYAPVAQNITVGTLAAATDAAVLAYSEQQKEHRQVVYDRKGKTSGIFESAGPTAYASDRGYYIQIRNEPASSNSIYFPFSLTAYTANKTPHKLVVRNNGFSVRYSSEGSQFGLPTYPAIVYDQGRSTLWLNDALFGINPLGIPK